MSVTNLADLLATAKAEGLGGGDNEVLPDGEYDLEILTVKAGSSKAGKPSFGVRVKVTSGPYAGKSTWVNQTLTADNATSVKIFCQTLLSLGVPQEAFTNGQAIENLYSLIAKGTQGKGKLGHHVFNGSSYQDLKAFAVTGVSSAAAAVPSASSVPVIPVTPVTPVAPAAAPAPAAVPVAPVAPVVPAPAAETVLSDPATAAAFAAFQAAQEAAAAPQPAAADGVPTPSF